MDDVRTVFSAAGCVVPDATRRVSINAVFSFPLFSFNANQCALAMTLLTPMLLCHSQTLNKRPFNPTHIISCKASPQSTVLLRLVELSALVVTSRVRREITDWPRCRVARRVPHAIILVIRAHLHDVASSVIMVIMAEERRITAVVKTVKIPSGRRRQTSWSIAWPLVFKSHVDTLIHIVVSIINLLQPR